MAVRFERQYIVGMRMKNNEQLLYSAVNCKSFKHHVHRIIIAE